VAVQQSGSLIDKCGRASMESYGNTHPECVAVSVRQDDTSVIDMKHCAHVSWGSSPVGLIRKHKPNGHQRTI